jgi:hypothetical protein
MDNKLVRAPELAADGSTKIAVLGARALVLSQFHAAAWPYLTAQQRVVISQSFREGIEDAMASMDDVGLPAEFHAALLELTNTILSTLRP